MMIKTSALLLLSIFLAGCISVRSPEKVQFTIGAGGEDQRDEDSPLDHPDHQDRKAERSPAASENRSPADDNRHGRPARRSGSKWQIPADIASTIVGEGVEGYIFFGCDILTTPGKQVKMPARVKAYTPDADVEGLTLTFYRLEDKKKIGSGKTNEYGSVWIPFQPKEPGDYRFYVKITALNEDAPRELLDLPPALLMVSVRKPVTKFVVVDLDRTLVASSFFRVMLWDGGNPMPGSQRVMRRIAESYDVIYLTHRPDDLARTSRLWLEKQGYPDGVLLLGSARGMLGDSGKLKSKRLRRVRKQFPNLMFGLGDKESDVEAYRDNGMKAIWIPHFKDKPKDLRKLARRLREWSDPNVIVVENWRQIYQAIFKDYRCSTTKFADMLDARAMEVRTKDDDDLD